MALTGSSEGTRSDGAARVRDSGITLFARRGFHGTGIRDLATEAGMSSASLYHHMATKEALLADIMTTALRRLGTAARLATGHVGDPVERLGRLIALHVLSHAARPDETRVVDNEVAALSPENRRTVVALRDDYEGLFAGTITNGVRDGVFVTDDPMVSRLALLDMCNGVSRWYSAGGELSTGTLADRYARIGLRTLGATEPRDGPDIAMCLRIVEQVWGA